MRRSLLSEEMLVSLDESRISVLASTNVTPHMLCVASDEQLLQLQKLLLMGNGWGTVEFPASWTGGYALWNDKRMYSLDQALPSEVDYDSCTGRRIWREILRATIAMRLWPSRMGHLLKPTTIMQNARAMGMMIRAFGATADGPFWGRYRSADVRDRFGKTIGVLPQLIAHFHLMGALPDRPETSRINGHHLRRDRTGEAEHRCAKNTSRPWQALPDHYASAAGWRASYFAREVGPALLDVLERVPFVQASSTNTFVGTLSEDSVDKERKKALDRFIASWDWRDASGVPLRTLPMTLRTKPGVRESWPPTTYADFRRMVQLLQASHLWLIALTLGARRGEIIGLTETCIHRESSATPTGEFTTWKLDGLSGRANEAPLPAFMVETLRQQIRLAQLIKHETGATGNGIWVTLSAIGGAGGRAVTLKELDPTLAKFNHWFLLEDLMEGSHLHVHRFRKTLARVIALALVHAPKILMDIFGHRDEQMTVMRYILSDQGILAEIEEITRELVILKGVEAVENVDVLEGAAAPRFRERVTSYAKLMGKRALEPQNLREFIQALTEDGAGWAIIGPGKVCTGFRAGGLCNDGNGEPNPHYCDPNCPNQLLLPDYQHVDGAVASVIVDAMETLDYMIKQLGQSDANGEDMLAAQFAGQVTALLHQWREVDRHFRAMHLDSFVIKKYLPNVVLLT